MEVDQSIHRKVKDTIAGFVGGAVQVLVGQPFDLVKVRIQTGQYSSPLSAFYGTLKNEGLLAFYKGTAAPLFGVGACVSVQFYAFHETKRRLQLYNNRTQLALPQFYIAGACAGIANSIVTSPVEQLRILLQTQQHGEYKGPRDALNKIVAQHGITKGLYRGFAITMLREAQAYGIWFMTFEYLISTQTCTIQRNDIPAWKLMLFGALAGEALWILSYPLDVIKTKIQSDGFATDTKKYHGSLDVVKKTLKVQGFQGFWKGIVPTLLRAIPASASTFASVELTLRLLG